MKLHCRSVLGDEFWPIFLHNLLIADGDLSLSNDDVNDNDKKAIGLDGQNNNSARASRFLVHFLVRGRILIHFPAQPPNSRYRDLSLSNDDVNENDKKAIGLDGQNNNSARASRFLVHFLVRGRILIHFPAQPPNSRYRDLSLSNDDVNENDKKAIGLDGQNNNSARASSFFLHFLAVSARLRRENT